MASEIGERPWENYQEFAQRDLSKCEILYMFVDGVAERIRPGPKREPVMAGSKEDTETVSPVFQDMRRGLGDPLLVTSDGAAGIVKAIEIPFPRSACQRCLVHRMRNLARKVPEDL